MSEETTEIRKGLAGVVVDTTAISSVNPATNSLLYRGYPVQELAAKCSFEEVAYLLWNGELPGDDDLEAFEVQERAQRALAPNVRRAIDDIPTSAHPMDVLRTAVSVVGADDADGAFGAVDDPFEVVYPKALRLMAQLPAIVAYDQRRRHGLPLVEPHDELDYASNFLYMTFGEVPDPVVVDAFRVSLILYAEHSFNASTFTARVIASTLSDVYSAVTGAIGALKGPLHGGANEAVMVAFDEIGSADKAEAWLDDALANKRKIMGFGHRVYKNGDSRVPTMKASLDKLVEYYDRPEV
ncbi:citrate/2-methylcitrate synthase, partial [Humibacter sp.]|uniref:citrate/2-methylcitrate synthase n=1 Tax=Humibacter sp. TaxID=1940291 RepID=UPI003F81295B